MSTKWTSWKCREDFMRMFPKPYVMPTYIFKLLSAFKTLSPCPPWLKCSSVFSVLPTLPCFFIDISMLYPRCLPHSSLSTDKFLGYRIRWTLIQFLNPGGLLSVAGVLCEQENGKLQSTLKFVAPYCVSWASSSSVLQGWWWMSNTYRRFIQLFGDSEKRWLWKMEKS